MERLIIGDTECPYSQQQQIALNKKGTPSGITMIMCDKPCPSSLNTCKASTICDTLKDKIESYPTWFQRNQGSTEISDYMPIKIPNPQPVGYVQDVEGFITYLNTETSTATSTESQN